MFGKKSTSLKGKTFPIEWTESLSRMLNVTYKKECEKAQKYFDVMGLIFDEELVLIVSFLSETNQYCSPVTLFLSHEISQDDFQKSPEKITKGHDFLLDMVGLFFDDIFSNSEEVEFSPSWQEASFKNFKVHYKISRENVIASIEANRLLGEDF